VGRSTAPSARALAIDALRRWRRGTEFADSILHHCLAQIKLTHADGALAQELFYGVIRNLTLLDFYIGKLRQGQVDAFSRDLLRLGLYQLLILQMPEHAAIFETVELAARRQKPFINGVLRNGSRNRNGLIRAAASAPFSVQVSHPEWLLNRWRKNFGEEAAISLARWNNRAAPIYARVNTLRISIPEFVAQNPQLEQVAGHPVFFRCDTLPHEAIEAGQCYIQDPSTEVAVELLQPKTGDRILDACAAPGGKTTFLCALTKNDARITACDRNAGRLDLLQKNLARLGARNVTVLQHDWSAGGWRGEQFDKILLDAPCTNTGVLRRRVDLRWRLRPEEFSRLHSKQMAIARAIIPLLKPGGVLIYSTCSMEAEENEAVVEQLDREFSQLRREQVKSVLPFRAGFDGAFAARFVSR
jgi:16S rRNA (cytosine967-C5)-methyltransferase